MSRTAYAIEQLVSEVAVAFPDATVSYGEPDGFDVVRSVTFDGVDNRVGDIINLVPDDRVAHTEQDGKKLHVELRGQSTLADDRRPFRINEVIAENGEADGEVEGESAESVAPDGDADKPAKAKRGAQQGRAGSS